MLKRLARFTNDKTLLDFWSSLSPAARERTAGILMIWRDDGSAEAGEFCTALLRQLETGTGMDGYLLDRFFVVFSGRVIAALGLEGALSWVALNVSPGDQAIALDDLFLAAENGGYSRDQVLAVFENLPSRPAKDGAAKSLARTFAQNDPRAALAWALRLPPDNSAAETMAMIALEWSQSAPEDATAMALRMSPGFQLDEFLDGLASGKIRTGGKEALDWALGLAVDRAGSAAIRVVDAWGENEPRKAYESVLEMTEGPYRDDIFRRVVSRRLVDDAVAPDWLAALEGKNRDLARQAIRESDLDPGARARALEVLDGDGGR